ncbi:putative nad+ adp-ribosyltransferase, partial [Operophtera brumata]
MRRSSPVQQWLDSLPSNAPEPTQSEPSEEDTETKVEVKSDDSKAEESLTGNTVIEPGTETEVLDQAKEIEVLEVPNRDMWKRKSLESGVLTSTPQRAHTKRLQRDHSIQSEGYSPKFKSPLFRDHSLQSDASGSSGSSVLNVLGARKVDAESVLIALGFGPSEKQQKLQRIPDRFLAPSKLKGISTEKFIKDEQHSMRMHDCGVFGYRGLTDHCTPVCRFMKPISPSCHRSYQVPQIADDVSREEALMKARHSIADMRSQSNVYAAILASRLRNL